jgi:hypothetical protein
MVKNTPKLTFTANSATKKLKSKKKVSSINKKKSAECPHGRRRNRCKECGASSFCIHNRRPNQCRDCGGSSICEHNRRKTMCIDCGGSSICKHNRQKNTCRECNGKGRCVHKKLYRDCKKCTNDYTARKINKYHQSSRGGEKSRHYQGRDDSSSDGDDSSSYGDDFSSDGDYSSSYGDDFSSDGDDSSSDGDVLNEDPDGLNNYLDDLYDLHNSRRIIEPYSRSSSRSPSPTRIFVTINAINSGNDCVYSEDEHNPF